MSGAELISRITQGTFILIALVALVEYLRYRDRARFEILLMFADFALIVLFQLLPDAGGSTAWTGKVNSILLVAHPYLLLRLIQHLQPVSANIRWFALGGMLLSWTAILLVPDPLPAAVTISIVIYFVLVEGYSTFAMVDGARKASGVAHSRLLLAAAGSGLIAALILVAGAAAVVPEAAPVLALFSQSLGLLAGICYFLGFATPPVLRRVWQRAELYHFLRSAPDPYSGQHFGDSLLGLCTAGLRASGGSLAVAALWNSEEKRLVLHTSCPVEIMTDTLDLDQPALQLAWQERRPAVLDLAADPGLQPQADLATSSPSVALVVPIASRKRAWGLLLVYLLRDPLFVPDDLGLLSLFAEQTAITLDYVSLLNEQENLIQKLRRYTQRLETVKEIDHEILAARLPEEIAKAALAHMSQVVPFDRASVSLFDHEKRQAHFIAVDEKMNLGPKEGSVLTLDDYSSLDVLSNPVFVIEDTNAVQSPTPNVEILRSRGIRSLMLIPLRVEGELIGALSLASRESSAFHEEHQDIALEISAQLAITIQQARLREELQRTNAELERRVAERTEQLERTVQELETEVAARKQASQALRAAQERLEYLLSATPAIIYSVNVAASSQVNYVSDNVLTQLGYEARQFLEDETFWLSRIHPDDIGRVQSYLRELPQKGYQALEYRFLHQNGSYVWMHDEFRVICNEQGSPVEIVGYWIDITKRRQAEDAIQRLNEDLTRRALELRAANRELQAFAYSVSHDLRSPLRAIDGFSRVLLTSYAEQLPDEARHYLQLVRDNTQDMAQLIDDLLSFSQVGQQSLNIKTVEPAGIVNLVLRDLLKEQEGREVEIVTGDLLACEADPVLLRQVFANLLSNALKFTGKREKARIEIGSHAQDGELLYHVKDNGIGFDMQYADKLFVVFQRLHRSEDFEGTGVGLAIAQRIVNRHGGRVWAQSEPGQGATFYFTLPKGNQEAQ